jgi:STE24 endopeptidase
MDSQWLFLTIIAIVVLNFLFGNWLGYLNSTTWSDKLPGSLLGIYDEEVYRKQQLYDQTKYKFSLITGGLSFLLILLMLLFQGFALLDEILRTFTTSPILLALVFFGILGLCSDLLSIPFELYDTFVIEQRFGFNTTSLRTFIFDKLKAWLLAGIIGGGILALVILGYEKSGDWFWLIVWGILSLFSILMNYLYTIIIVPLFNKLTPLPEGGLRTSIEEFSSRVGFKLSNVFVIDGSKRSKHANAYFSGFGKMKKIVLYDTLISDHTEKEIVAILAHEIGHYKHKHIIKGLVTGILHSGALLFIFSLFISNPLLSAAIGSTHHGFHLGLISFAILYTPISTVLGLITNMVSRKHEYQADHFAAVNFDASSLKDALIKLSVKNLSNLTPHPTYVFFHYSHPPLLQRLKAIEERKKD